MKFPFHRLENIVGKGQNAGYHNVLTQDCPKLGLCGKGLYLTIIK